MIRAPIEVKVTNTLTGKKETLVPREAGKIGMYSCGPTVWGQIHVGNLMAATTSDLIYRTLQKLGYAVTYVRNYTDVDDKIIKRANDEGVAPEAITKRYISEVERDYAAAGLLEPTRKTLVTDHMPEIIAMIERIIVNGKAYVDGNGEVFFSIADFPSYGKLSKNKVEDLVAGARVEVNSSKRNPADFTLWKPAKPGEPFWDSPWGKGRPGWHIECSAMASKWLGAQMDIHHGGSDLVFPHHECEIAQSEAASGLEPYAKYWLHNGMLNINAEKMSKSLGNFITARDFLTQYGGEVTRMMFMSSHYRSMADFGGETLETAIAGLQRLYEAKARAEEIARKKTALPDLRAENAWSEFLADAQKARGEITDAMANDFNSPGALSAVFSLVRAFNRTLAEPRAEATPAAILGAEELVRVLEDEIGGFLGIGRQPSASMLDRLNEVKRARSAESAGSAGAAGAFGKDEIEALIQARLDARKAKNFAEADRIRKELDEKGVAIKDGPQGTTWSYK